MYLETYSRHFHGGEAFILHSQGRFGVGLGRITRIPVQFAREREHFSTFICEVGAFLRRKGSSPVFVPFIHILSSPSISGQDRHGHDCFYDTWRTAEF